PQSLQVGDAGITTSSGDSGDVTTFMPVRVSGNGDERGEPVLESGDQSRSNSSPDGGSSGGETSIGSSPAQDTSGAGTSGKDGSSGPSSGSSDGSSGSSEIEPSSEYQGLQGSSSQTSGSSKDGRDSDLQQQESSKGS
ncbi:MAG: hypothetical protein ACRDK2_02595, partial [Solirubrobacteraceae bacterium]